jgi:hypothetical protein
MVEKNGVESDVKKQEASGCRKSVGWGCLISIVLISAIVGYVMYSASHNMKVRGDNSTAGVDGKIAYMYAQKYFADYPSGELSLSLLHQYGYQNSDKVTLTVVDGKKESLKLKSEHQEGTKICLVDQKGFIQFKEK